MLGSKDWTKFFKNLENKKDLIKLVRSYFQTDEIRNLFEIPWIINSGENTRIIALGEKCPYWEFFWSKCGKMRENANQKNFEYAHFSRCVTKKKLFKSSQYQNHEKVDTKLSDTSRHQR